MRIRVNPSERAFEELATSRGWTVTKRGWPDFICRHPDGRVVAVEVKPRIMTGKRFKRLKKEQRACLQMLERAGVKCYISDGVVTERFNTDKH